MAQPPITPISLPRISGSDLENKGVTGLPDTPNLSAPEMQRKFDEIGREVIPPIVNNLSSAAEGYINDLYEKERVNEDHISSIGTLLIDTEKRVDKAEGDIRVLNDACDNLEENKVDKVPGKGLSTNDYTNTDKANLSTSFENSREALSNSNIALTNSNEAFQKAQDAQADVARFGTKLEDVRQRAEKSLTTVIAEDENKNEYESYSIKTIDYDRITGKTTVSAITEHIIIPNADEKFRKNLMYGNIEGASPLNAKTLSGATEISLKGRCEQSAYGLVNGGWGTDGTYYDNTTTQGKPLVRSANAFKCANGDTVTVKHIGSKTVQGVRIVFFKGSTFKGRADASTSTPKELSYVATDSDNFYMQTWCNNEGDALSAKASDFVILVNGLPAQPIPTPTAPIPIEYAHEDDLIKSYGKNLFEPNNVLNAYIYEGNVNIKANDNSKLVYAECKPNTQCRISKLAGKRFRVAYTTSIPANDVRAYSIVSNDEADEILYTTGADAKYIVAFVYNDQQDSVAWQTMKSSVIISLASEYSEVPLPCDLLGLPNAQDELKEGYVTRRVARVVLDGSVPFTFVNNCFQTNNAFPSDLGNKMFAMSDTFKFEYYPSAITDNISVNAFGWNNANRLTIKVSGITSESAFANWLNEHKPTIVYELATPTSAPADRIELPTYNEQTTFKADYCEISADVAQNGLDVIDDRTKEVYSTDEVAIGTWVDGSTLYRRYVEIPKMSLAGESWTAIPQLNFGMALCAKCDAIAISDDYKGTVPLACIVRSADVAIKNNSTNAINNVAGLVVEYTKASASGRSAEPMMLAEEVEE